MNQKVILLVEDNPDDELLTLRALEKNNIRNKVIVAHDGAEALDYLLGAGCSEAKGVNDLPQIILLDLNLPKISGLEVLRRLRADMRTQTIPVIIFTSSKEEQDLLMSYRDGANSYIQKPVDFQQFMEAIGTLGLYWLDLNETPPR